jgi:hypothetical protein
MKTYPKDWLDRCDEDSAALASPKSLSEAGFYCSAWQHSSAWVKCFSCSAHAGQLENCLKFLVKIVFDGGVVYVIHMYMLDLVEFEMEHQLTYLDCENFN